MDARSAAIPEDVEALKAALAAAHVRADAAEAMAASAVAKASDDRALVVYLKLEIEKLKRQIYGHHSERSVRLLDQMQLQLEASATADEIAAEMAAAKAATNVAAFTRRRPSRQPFPEHLPRERVVIPAPASCPCCGGARLSKGRSHLPYRPGRGEADRRRLRHRARDQRLLSRRAPSGAPRQKPTPCRRLGSLDAGSARQALPP